MIEFIKTGDICKNQRERGVDSLTVVQDGAKQGTDDLGSE